MTFFCRFIFALLLCAISSKYETEASTRWQPSIIWNRFNPLLTCRCNWMNIPELAIYDRVELVCPKLYLVSAFRKKDMAKREVYYNIFSRKYDYSNDEELNGLRKMLDNGSFCDTTHNETKKLYTCRRDDIDNKKLYNSYRLRFHSDEDLNAGEIVVFFSNKKTGLETDLASKEKKCAMVFVVKIIDVPKDEKDEYDLSYGKCFEGDEDCKYDNITSCPKRNCANNTIYKNHTIYKTIYKNHTMYKTIYENNTTYINHTIFRNNTMESAFKSASKSSNDEFHLNGFGVGFGTAILLILILAVVVYVIVVKIKGKLMFVKEIQELEIPMKKQASGGKDFDVAVTITTSVNSDSKVINTNDEKDIKEYRKLSNGFPNQGFQPSTPAAPPQDAEQFLNTPRSSNGRLPSVDGGAKDRNAEDKNHAYEIVART